MSSGASSAFDWPWPVAELDLDPVLMSGQTFRWRKVGDGWWIAVIDPEGGTLRIRRDGAILRCRTAPGTDAAALARSYFRADVSLPSLSAHWRQRGETLLADAVKATPGLRLVRQDPTECLFGFICSAAAPIHRIRRSMDGLCRAFGTPLGDQSGLTLHAFPRLEALADAARAQLDPLGLGFRGRYIPLTARQLLERGGAAWLEGLRRASYAEAKAALVTLPGVGEKIADCVCLFALDKDEAVPIDVHMARVARRLFPECAECPTLTPRAYARFGDAFRNRFGPYAGWAQQYLFYAEIAARGLWDQELGKHRPRTAPQPPILGE